MPLDRFIEPSQAGDESGNVGLAAIETLQGFPEIFIAASQDRGETWTVGVRTGGTLPGNRRRPRVATGAPGEIYVAWEDSRNGNVDIYFNRSADGGRTWLASEVRVNTNPAAGSRIAAPSLACDDRGNVYMAWLDDREGFTAIYSNRSSDGGRTWGSADRRVTGISLGRKAAPHLACNSRGEVFVAWMELRDGARRIYVNGSSDNGSTWMIDDASLSNGTLAVSPEICVLESGTIFVTWLESSHGGEIFYSRSTDRGRFWSPAQVFASRPRELGHASMPRLATDRRYQVYVAWHALAVDGTSRLILHASNDEGTSFVTTVMTRTTAIGSHHLIGEDERPDAPFNMVADRVGNVYFAWVESLGGVPSVGFDRVANFGRTWMRLQESPSSLGHSPITAAAPGLSADDSGHVCVMWNEGSYLHIAASPFYGDTGWRHSDL